MRYRWEITLESSDLKKKKASPAFCSPKTRLDRLTNRLLPVHDQSLTISFLWAEPKWPSLSTLLTPAKGKAIWPSLRSLRQIASPCSRCTWRAWSHRVAAALVVRRDLLNSAQLPKSQRKGLSWARWCILDQGTEFSPELAFRPNTTAHISYHVPKRADR